MRRGWMVVILVASLLGCDSGPKGPGEMTGVVQTPGPALGGAVLQVVGKGITGFSGAGGTHLVWAAAGPANTYRVVLLAETVETLRFQVSVEDRGGRKPDASVVSLVTGDNLPIPVTDGYRIVFTR